jgi:hypothetical protein
MSTPVDIITMFISQVLSYTTFVSSLAVGYSLFFFFFYYSDFWKHISFGERLAFGLGIGVPFSYFTSLVTSLFVTVLGFLNFGYDFNFLWGTADVILIIAFAYIRALVGTYLNSEEGRRWYRNFLEGRRIFYPYLIPLFFALLALSLPSLDPTASIASIDLIWNIVLGIVLVLYLSILIFLLPLCFLFGAPSIDDSFQLFFHSVAYLFFISYLSKYYDQTSYSYSNLSWKTKKWFKSVRTNTKTIPVAIVGILVFAIFVSFAAGTEPIFSPRLVGDVTTYGYNGSSNDAMLVQEYQTQSIYWVILPAQTTYFFDNAAWPILNTSVVDPANVTQPGTTACTGGQSISIPTYTYSNGISVSPVCGPKSPESYQIKPLQIHSKEQARFDLSYNENLTFSTFSISSISSVKNFTDPNGTKTDMFVYTITNNYPYILVASNFYFLGLPQQANRTSSSAFCTCAGGDRFGNETVQSLYGTTGIQSMSLDDLIIGARVTAYLYVNLTYSGK